MAELVDAHDSKSCVLGHVGSIPTLGTEKGFFGSLFFIPKNLIPQGHQLRCHHNELCHPAGSSAPLLSQSVFQLC